MTVDEKGLEAAARAFMAAWQMEHTTEEALRRAITAYLSARSAEPVAWRVKDYADSWALCRSHADAIGLAGGSDALIQPLFAHPTPEASEIGEEEIAKIVRRAMRSDPEEGPFRHRESERSLIAAEAARQILALLQPALERARREERERERDRCARVIEDNQLLHTSGGDVLTPRGEGNRNGLGYAAAIRKGPGE